MCFECNATPSQGSTLSSGVPEPPRSSSPSLSADQSRAPTHYPAPTHTHTHTHSLSHQSLSQHYTQQFIFLTTGLNNNNHGTGNTSLRSYRKCCAVCLLRNFSRKNSARRISCSGRPVNTSVMSLQLIKSR